MCDSADSGSSLIQKLSYLRFDDDNPPGRPGSRPEAQVPVPSSSSRPLGAIESFMEPEAHRPALPASSDYKHYERENIIASARFATPKAVEQIDEQQLLLLQQKSQQSPVYENIEYYPQHTPATYPPYYHPVDSRRCSRESPRASIAGEQFDPGYKVGILLIRLTRIISRIVCLFE